MADEKIREISVTGKKETVLKAKIVAEINDLLGRLDVVEQHRIFRKLLTAGGMPIAPFGKQYESFKEFVATNKIVAERPTLVKPRPDATLVLDQLPGLPGLIAGGKKEMHLHLDGKTYLLNKVQAANFQKEFAPNLKADIACINEIQF